MIITDIKLIDRIAEETFGSAKGLVSVDMKDYAFIKEHSESLKAINLDVTAFSEATVRSLDEAIVEVGKENLGNLIFFIRGNGGDAGMQPITIEQFSMFTEVLNKHFESANIIWGMSERSENCEKISVLLILGYGKKE